jgi:hypothetical protein
MVTDKGKQTTLDEARAKDIQVEQARQERQRRKGKESLG